MQNLRFNPQTDEWDIPIYTPRLIIRQPTLADTFILNQAKNDSFTELAEFMEWAQSQESIEDTTGYLKECMANWILKENRYPFLLLLIFDKFDNLVGATGYHYYDWNVPCLDIGYWCNTKFIKNGYITEAVNALTRYALDYLGCRKVTIACDSINLASRKIPERLGFELEGILKSNIINPGTKCVSDTVYYACFDADTLPELNVGW